MKNEAVHDRGSKSVRQQSFFSFGLRTLLLIMVSTATLLAWFNTGVGIMVFKTLFAYDVQQWGPPERMTNLNEYTAWENNIPADRWGLPRESHAPLSIDFKIHDLVVLPLQDTSNELSGSAYKPSVRFGGRLVILDSPRVAPGSRAEQVGIPKNASIWYTRQYVPLACDIAVVALAIAIPALSHFHEKYRRRIAVSDHRRS